VRLSEIYTSVQGEGPRTGEPTVFVRFAGCDMRCPGWPCDTPYAIDPAKYRSEWQECGPQHIIDQLDTYPRNICLTGGEPFLQPKDEMSELLKALNAKGYRVEAFTNGTAMEFPMKQRFRSMNGKGPEHCNYVLDWKLGGSGQVIAPKMQTTRALNLENLGEGDAVKFTLNAESDWSEAVAVHMGMSFKGNTGPRVYVGRVWESEFWTDEEIVKRIIKSGLNWYLNVQLHKYVWDPKARRT
jgi:7-carboxy-7-deazaguanine synthase